MPTTKQSTKEEFFCPTPAVNPETNMNFLELALTNNLNNFVTHAGYINSMVVGGKMDPEQGYEEVKKLYKAMKSSRKSLRGSWF